jgi:hypothetical protein
MPFLKFIKNQVNVLLFALILLFFLAPALEESRFVIITSPFALLVVAILSLRVISLRQRNFWQMILFLVIGFFLDLILTFTTEPFLEGMLTIAVRMIYLSVFALALILLTKRLLTSTTDSPVVSFKIGLCGYLLIGVLWSVVYALIYSLDRGSLSALESAQLPFFYFSYSVLTSLRFSTVFPLNLWSITACFLESIAGQVFLVIFIARMAVTFIKHQMYS